MIIFINGSINSGKSTIAKILADKLPKTAHIEVDDLRNFIRWMPLEESIPINLENTVSIIKNFVKRRINVIITYPLSEPNFDYLQDELKNLGEKIYIFTLNPELDTILNRGKKLTKWEKERIKYHYQIGINNPGFGIVIDTTHQTPEQTANFILSQLQQ